MNKIDNKILGIKTRSIQQSRGDDGLFYVDSISQPVEASYLSLCCQAIDSPPENGWRSIKKMKLALDLMEKLVELDEKKIPVKVFEVGNEELELIKERVEAFVVRILSRDLIGWKEYFKEYEIEADVREVPDKKASEN